MEVTPRPLTIDVDEIEENIPELSGQIVLNNTEPEFRGNYSYVYKGTVNGQAV
jgi:hypothetical protein